MTDMLPWQLSGQWPGLPQNPTGIIEAQQLCPRTPGQHTKNHLKFGCNEDGRGANELQVLPHDHHLHQVVVHQLHSQVQCLMVQLKVLL